MLFIALAYTTLDRLCAVFLYNPTLAVHHMWFYTSRHVWLYINTHLSVYSGISLCHRRLYMYITVRGYTCIFTLKAVLQHSHFTIWLHAWLYHFMCGYTLNTWLYTFIYTLTFHCTACGYTSRYTVILVISRIYTYVIVPYIFQHRPLCLLLKV